MSAAATIWRQRDHATPSPLADTLAEPWVRLYASRGIHQASELDYSLERLPDGAQLAGMGAAVDCLARAIRERRRILVVADYDCDGATACAVAMRGLSRLGAEDLDFIVPDRAVHGYGLSPALATLALQRQPKVLLTVDNGIASLEGIAEARRSGVEVVVTDHHLPGQELPAATAIVNPNQPGDGSGLRCLAGVGVIFLVLRALRRALFADQQAAPPLGDLLPLVALGTVADVVPLDYLNRLLVAQGLKRLREGKGAVGLKALAQVAGRNPARLATTDLGFAIGPRINAAGRLKDMGIGIRCLLTDDPTEAQALARTLDQLNRERRDIQADMESSALAGVIQKYADAPLEALSVFQEDWHHGVVGILAGRLKERFDCPVVAFAPAEDGSLRGSARSVPGLHVRDVLATINAQHPGLISRFGGHAMAAGLSLEARHLAAFEQHFQQAVVALRDPACERGVLWTDGRLEAAQHCLPLAEALADGVWGQAFPEPVFADALELVSHQVVAGKHLKLRLRHGQGQPLTAMAFNTTTVPRASAGQAWEFAYRLVADDYGGARQLLLQIVAMRNPVAPPYDPQRGRS